MCLPPIKLAHLWFAMIIFIVALPLFVDPLYLPLISLPLFPSSLPLIPSSLLSYSLLFPLLPFPLLPSRLISSFPAFPSPFPTTAHHLISSPLNFFLSYFRILSFSHLISSPLFLSLLPLLPSYHPLYYSFILLSSSPFTSFPLFASSLPLPSLPLTFSSLPLLSSCSRFLGQCEWYNQISHDRCWESFELSQRGIPSIHFCLSRMWNPLDRFHSMNIISLNSQNASSYTIYIMITFTLSTFIC